MTRDFMDMTAGPMSPHSNPTTAEAGVDEPLAMSAAFARALSQTTCAQEDEPFSCCQYHGFWQYLRLMGLGKTMSGMSTEFVQAIRGVANSWADRSSLPSPKVLISGCADYSALAHVVHALRGSTVLPEVTALDRCQTPLVLARWYAQRVDWTVRVVCGDILAHRPPAAYDLILTSSFLGYFSPDARRELFAAYAGMLRPGGVLLFANRLRPEPENRGIEFAPEQVTAFADQVARLAPQLPADAALSAQEARELACRYAAKIFSYPVNSEDTLRRLAQGAGLAWAGSRSRRSAAVRSGVSGPTLADGSPYCMVMLERPS